MRIRDYGPGVPEDEMSLIANKFYRGKKWADSKEEDGFCITLLIPLS